MYAKYHTRCSGILHVKIQLLTLELYHTDVAHIRNHINATLPGRTKSFTSFEELNMDASAVRERQLTTILHRHCAMSDTIVVKYIVHRVTETMCGHSDAEKALREVFEDETVNFLVRELNANNINLRVVMLLSWECQ